MTRVCVFVDGENLRHTIVDLFDPDPFNRSDYLPRNAKWGELFDSLVANATENQGSRIRTYWYVINAVDPYPWVLKPSSRSNENLLNWRQRHQNLLRRANLLNGLTGEEEEVRLKALHSRLRETRDKIKRRFDGFSTIQNKIAYENTAVEFRRSGAIGYNLLTCEFGQEKTVDVNLGVDLVLLREMYDLALIVSGDQDYVPAVQAVKNFGKHVVNVAFEDPSGKLLPGGARRLNDITDWSISVPFEDFRTGLGLEVGADTAKTSTTT